MLLSRIPSDNIKDTCNIPCMKRFVTIKWQARIIVPVYTPCMECCGQAEIVYAFQSIEKKVKKGSIKESPWRSG